MNHLGTGRTFANLPKTGQAGPLLELSLLLTREMKKAQRQLPAAIADSNEQIAPAAVHGFRKQDLTRDKAATASFERTEFDQLGSIFIPQRQQEQEVFDPMKIQSAQLVGKCGADSAKNGQR